MRPRRRRQPRRLGQAEPTVTLTLTESEARLAAGALAVMPRDPNKATVAATAESARRKLRRALDSEQEPQGELAERLRQEAL